MKKNLGNFKNSKNNKIKIWKILQKSKKFLLKNTKKVCFYKPKIFRKCLLPVFSISSTKKINLYKMIIINKNWIVAISMKIVVFLIVSNLNFKNNNNKVVVVAIPHKKGVPLKC